MTPEQHYAAAEHIVGEVVRTVSKVERRRTLTPVEVAGVRANYARAQVHATLATVPSAPCPIPDALTEQHAADAEHVDAEVVGDRIAAALKRHTVPDWKLADQLFTVAYTAARAALNLPQPTTPTAFPTPQTPED